MFSSKSDQWATPKEFYDLLNQEFQFTLDPCADYANHKCDKFFTKEIDGLKQDWNNENVFCNPPYGREMGIWVKKCYDEVMIKKRCNIAVMLIPARTDTRWFHDYIYNNAEIRFIKGRLKFGGAKYNAPFPCMVVIYR